jgi:hypothetical protein
MKTRNNLITERAGVNFVRGVTEAAGCLFKEINLQHDFGHDGTIMLIKDGNVLPREVALQIKSGISYISSTTCSIPATADHIYFWAEHDLVTVGVVYDPLEDRAWWTDLQTASRDFRRLNSKSGTSLVFKKSAWNQLNEADFKSILIPTLVGEAPQVSLERVCSWVKSGDLETHDIGVRTIRARHYKSLMAWDCLIESFQARDIEHLTFNLPIALAKLLGHDDMGYYSDEIPQDIRRLAMAKVLRFGSEEIAKLLSMLPDRDFDRGSPGYSLMPLFGQRADSPLILAAIRDSHAYDPTVRKLASALYEWYQREPHWWSFWRRDD